MKKKAIIVTIFFGFILLSSTIMLVLPGFEPPGEEDPEVTITGTPADNFPDEQRVQFCGSGDAKSTDFVKEFSIPTPCTNPLGNCN